MAAQGETIYTYEVQLTSSAPEYRLSTYRTDGTPLGQYALDLADLLPASGDLAQDAVIGLEVPGELRPPPHPQRQDLGLGLDPRASCNPSPSPQRWKRACPAGYRLLPQWDPDSPALFFGSAAPALYRFNAQTQTFSSALLPEDIPQNVTWHGSCGHDLLLSTQQDGQGRSWYLLRVDLA